jgi:hypothetical protein
VSITRASPEEQEQLRGLLAGTLLEGCVKFGRLNYAQMLRDLCKSHHQARSIKGSESDSSGPDVVIDARDMIECGHTNIPLSAGAHKPGAAATGLLGPSQLCACVVLALFFCGHPVIAAELEKAVEQIGHESAGQPGAPLIMYGSETVFG